MWSSGLDFPWSRLSCRQLPPAKAGRLAVEEASLLLPYWALLDP